MITKALYYHQNNNHIICDLCPHQCALLDRAFGLCQVRQAIDNQLVTHNYGEVSTLHIDPIEKKPLARFMQGTKTLSVGSYGCNFHCSFCQNFDISILKPTTQFISPEVLVQICLDKGLPSIAYTYNEPTVFYEYVMAVAKLAHEKGLKNILVTNGYINPKPIEGLLPYIDAVNIDYKATEDVIYTKVCGGNGSVIERTIALLGDCHIEISFLIVPNVNDDLDGLRIIFKRLALINPNLVIHVNRYFPQYQMDTPATELLVLSLIQQLALEYFSYVFIGNVSLF